MSAAIQRFQALIDQDPGNHLARFSLGKALFDAERFSEAKAQFQAALERKPDWMVAQILLGKCWLALCDKEQAISAFQRGLELAIAQHHEGPQVEMENILAELRV